MEASEKAEKAEKTKVSILRHVMREEALDVYNTFTFEPDNQGNPVVTLEIVQEKFQRYCTPKKTLTLERYNFNQKRQQPDEPVVTRRLRTQAKCENMAPLMGT